MRIDYAMLSRYSIQSTSDQENYLDYCHDRGKFAERADTGTERGLDLSDEP